MLVAHTGEKYLLKILTEVFVVNAYPHDAVLDDIGHKHWNTVRISTLIVCIKGNCYMENEDFFIFLMRFERK